MSKNLRLRDTVYAYKVFVEDGDKVSVQLFQGTLAIISYRGENRYLYNIKTASGDLIGFTENSHIYKSKKNLLRALKEDVEKRTQELQLKGVRLQEAFFDGIEKAKELL